MSEAMKDLVVSSEVDKVGPDFFGYFTSLVTDLGSQEEDIQLFASQSSDISRSRYAEVKEKDSIEESVKNQKYYTSLFGSSVGTGFSDFKKERLKSLLKQGVKFLSPEVDEMLEPVVAISRLKSQLKSRKRKRESKLGSAMGSEQESGEVDDELQSLIESDSLQVEETVKKYSDELFATLGHMEHQLEKLLDTVMSTCRPMTLPEKHKLGKLIQKLPPKNLDRVVEMIQPSNATYTNSSDEIHMDLEKQSNVTLWRLYYYVEAVEKARKLAK